MVSGSRLLETNRASLLSSGSPPGRWAFPACSRVEAFPAPSRRWAFPVRSRVGHFRRVPGIGRSRCLWRCHAFTALTPFPCVHGVPLIVARPSVCYVRRSDEAQTSRSFCGAIGLF